MHNQKRKKIFWRSYSIKRKAKLRKKGRYLQERIHRKVEVEPNHKNYQDSQVEKEREKRKIKNPKRKKTRRSMKYRCF